MKKWWPPICKNCQNFIIEDNEYCACDFEYFENVPLSQALLYTPKIFECIDFEYHIEIKENMERGDIN